MDKKIKKLEKKTKSLEKDEKALLKMDKKRDKACDMGEKMMHKKGKKQINMFSDNFIDQISKLVSIEELIDLSECNDFKYEIVKLAEKYSIPIEYAEI